jgi:hypothetical protein
MVVTTTAVMGEASGAERGEGDRREEQNTHDDNGVWGWLLVVSRPLNCVETITV